MSDGVFRLNPDETFPRLKKPPIVEAAIRWQARPERKLDQTTLEGELPRLFPQFSKFVPMHAMVPTASDSPWGDETSARQQSFLGFRLQSEAEREVVQVFRDAIALKIVKDYSNWDSFGTAAKNAWAAFVKLTSPIEIQRLSVRFINHFPTVTVGSLKDILREPPTCPENLPLKEFVYQSRFDVPSYEYGVRVIKVLQQPTPGMQDSSGLFLDLETYTTKAIPSDSEKIDETLKHLRWLKNKVFFSLLTEHATRSLS